MKGAADYVKIV